MEYGQLILRIQYIMGFLSTSGQAGGCNFSDTLCYWHLMFLQTSSSCPQLSLKPVFSTRNLSASTSGVKHEPPSKFQGLNTAHSVMQHLNGGFVCKPSDGILSPIQISSVNTHKHLLHYLYVPLTFISATVLCHKRAETEVNRLESKPIFEIDFHLIWFLFVRTALLKKVDTMKNRNSGDPFT